MNQVELNKDVLILTAKSSTSAVRTGLWLMALLLFGIPFYGILQAINLGTVELMHSIIYFIVFGSIGLYMLRIAIWNSFGKEHFILDENSITYQADFQFYKTEKRVILINESVRFHFIPSGYNDNSSGILEIRTGKHSFTSSCPVMFNQMEKVINHLNERYKLPPSELSIQFDVSFT